MRVSSHDRGALGRETFSRHRVFMKRPNRRIGVRHFIAGGVFGQLRPRFIADFSVETGGYTVGDKTARIQAVELIEQRAIALVDARNVSVICERRDSIIEVFDREPSSIVNAIQDGRNTGLEIWDRARASKAA